MLLTPMRSLDLTECCKSGQLAVVGEKKQEQCSLKRVSAMPSCRYGRCEAHEYVERGEPLFFSNLWEDDRILYFCGNWKIETESKLS